jgi:hypothetical protein
MEADRALLVLAAIVVLVLLSNAVVFAVVRGMARGGKSDWISTLRDSFRKPGNHPANQSMEELRKRVEELEARKKSDGANG